MFQNKVTTAPTVYPVTLDEAKSHLNVTFEDDDDKIYDFIKMVTAEVERFCGISICPQTREWIFDFNRCEPRTIPYGPVTSITSVSKKTAFAEYTALTVNEDYTTDQQEISGLHGVNKIVYVAGFTTVPDDLKMGILNQIAFRYENAGEQGKEGFSIEAHNILTRYKDFNWI